MYNPDKARQTIYWLILLLSFILALSAIIYPGKILANYDEPQLFINYKALRERKAQTNVQPPKIIQQPIVQKPKAQNTSPYNGRHYSKEEVIELIKQYSQHYEINPAAPLCIARLESGYNQFSANRSSSARGVFQYLSGTWKATDEGRANLSVFDAEANVRAAVKYMGVHRSTKPWTVRTKCPPLQFL